MYTEGKIYKKKNNSCEVWDIAFCFSDSGRQNDSKDAFSYAVERGLCVVHWAVGSLGEVWAMCSNPDPCSGNTLGCCLE